MNTSRHASPPPPQPSRRWLPTLSLGVLIILANACDAPPPRDDHGHAHTSDEPPHGDHAHGDHAHGETHESQNARGHGEEHGRPSTDITLWGAQTQLFVEFPVLVRGEPSPMAAHLTRLEDHAAISKGTVIVELSGGDKPVERFSVSGPSVAGIFRPVVEPVHAGRRKITLRLDSPMASESFELGEIPVYPTIELASAAEHSHEEEEHAERIAYLLEQQWKVPFNLAAVQARQMRPGFEAFATLEQPPQSEALLVAPRNGRLVAPNGRFPILGEEVIQGAPLFYITSAPRDGGEPATLDLDVERATINLNAAQREVDRLAPLTSRGVVPSRRLDDAKSTLESARAELQAARRRRGNLSQTQRIDGASDALQIPSPIQGAVAQLLVSPGAWVSQGDALARVVDRARLHLNVHVPEAYVGRLEEVSGAWFELRGARGIIDVPASSLLAIGSEIDPSTRTLPIRFALDNVRHDLFAGMHTKVHLVSDSPRLTTAIPTSAIVHEAGVDVIYVQTSGESFERRPVQLGIYDGEFVEVLEGVSPGEWIVSRGAYLVKLATTATDTIGHGHAH